MNPSLIKIFRMLAQEFDAVSDHDLQKWFELTKPLLSEKQYGAKYDQALALLVAHRLKLSGYGEDGEFGSVADSLRVSSFSEGSTSVSFGSPASGTADGDLALTPYGLQYLAIRRMSIVPIICSGEQS